MQSRRSSVLMSLWLDMENGWKLGLYHWGIFWKVFGDIFKHRTDTFSCLLAWKVYEKLFMQNESPKSSFRAMVTRKELFGLSFRMKTLPFELTYWSYTPTLHIKNGWVHFTSFESILGWVRAIHQSYLIWRKWRHSLFNIARMWPMMDHMLW
jgi:hypothetical protein